LSVARGRDRVAQLDLNFATWLSHEFVKDLNTRMSIPLAVVLRALANERRLQILEWLINPRAHFPPQADGDLVADGVCSMRIAQKLKVLAGAGLVRVKRVKQWTFFSRDERQIREIKKIIAREL
jgi:DNA-binding transcriptional ArsR family regulator